MGLRWVRKKIEDGVSSAGLRLSYSWLRRLGEVDGRGLCHADGWARVRGEGVGWVRKGIEEAVTQLG